MFTVRHFIRTFAIAAAGTVGLVLLAVSPASATDFCLDMAAPNCPAGAVENLSLDAAMVDNGDDGIADRVFVPAGTITSFPGLSPNGTSLSDDLEVIGAGREQTILTSNATTNDYVVNLNGIFNREVTMRDLTIRVPASFPDTGGRGAALQANGDTFRRVNFESRNPVTGGSGSAGASSVIDGGVFDDVRFFGSEGGGFGSPVIATGGWFPGDSLEILNSDIRDFQGGITSTVTSEIPVHIKRTHLSSQSGFVLGVFNTDSSIENSVIEAGEYPPILVGTSNGTSQQANLTFKNNTLLNLGGAESAIRVLAGDTAVGNANAFVTDSIIFGFTKTWELQAAVGAAGFGNSNFDISYSNFDTPGTAVGDGTVNASLGNINENPQFTDLTEYRLSPTSPSIDAGNPAAGGIIDDIEGTVRPLDGNGDGTRVRDQGAYEAAEIPSCTTDTALCPKPPPDADVTAPVVSKLRSKRVGKKSKVFKLTYRLSEAAGVRFTFKPMPARKNGKKRKTVKVSKRGKAGPNTMRIKKRGLKPGRYRITVTPTDAAGNVGKSLVVKAIYLGGRKQKLNVQLN